MIKHQLFSKGDQIHALISTTQQPNLLIPVRATIYDVKFDDVNPQYQIRVKKFYDQVYFLKKNLFGGRFIKDFEGLPGSGRNQEVNMLRDTIDSVLELVAQDPEILEEQEFLSDFIRALAMKKAMEKHGIFYDA